MRELVIVTSPAVLDSQHTLYIHTTYSALNTSDIEFASPRGVKVHTNP